MKLLPSSKQLKETFDSREAIRMFDETVKPNHFVADSDVVFSHAVPLLPKSVPPFELLLGFVSFLLK